MCRRLGCHYMLVHDGGTLGGACRCVVIRIKLLVVSFLLSLALSLYRSLDPRQHLRPAPSISEQNALDMTPTAVKPRGAESFNNIIVAVLFHGGSDACFVVVITLAEPSRQIVKNDVRPIQLQQCEYQQRNRRNSWHNHGTWYTHCSSRQEMDKVS